ncbi:MAG: glycosyltransferase family 39 protein [Acidobacteriota bacterium]|nr:glycosyltransferase family 39 protein [Acidobacteriota bacterium]
MQTARRQPVSRPPVRFRSYALVFGLIASFLILAHGPLLRLPFYWDEIGQFVPASLDLFHKGAWIPFSTLPNVHPPGVMAYLALFWTVFGYSVTATRIAMLLIGAGALLVTFLLGIELSRGATGAPAFAAVALLAISPLFYAQSMMAQLDMPAMCLSCLALLLFLQNRVRASAIACAALAIVKETGLVVPAVFAFWVILEGRTREERARALWFLLPLPGLAVWLLTLHRATGHWFGNAAFAAYNLAGPLHPIPFVLALLRRIYFLFIATGHIVGAVALIWAWRRMPILRSRPWHIAGSFVLANVLVVSALGGAVLERYTLPVLPVIYIAFATSLQALMLRTRRLALAALTGCLAVANFVNPLYPFPFENNLAFTDFVVLEQEAASAVEQRAVQRTGAIATAFPMADALRNPEFGFVRAPLQVIDMDGFSAAEVEKLKTLSPAMVVVCHREWDPLHLLDKPAVNGFLSRYYGYKPELKADAIAAALSMRVGRRWRRRGMTMELLERYPAPRS